jgi:hypothetical protein
MSFKKQYLKSKDRCKVTFRLPKAAASGLQPSTSWVNSMIGAR